MKKELLPQIKEEIYRKTLPNGLDVVILPKKDYHKTYSVFTTNYGSIDDTFIPLGETERVTVPDGIAHFLEHKMFEKETYDAFELFGKTGASANAFTSFTRTSYLFSSASKVKENLETLLDFVQNPYFTEKTVEKEKGIIGQEIQMYDDDPDWRSYFGLIGNLFPNHPAHIDIAGTVDSISKITAADLYQCYETFYHPSNMTLFIIGQVDPKEAMGWVEANQSAKTFKPSSAIERFFEPLDETGSDIMPYRAIEMPVKRSKSMVGIKGLENLEMDRGSLVYKTALELLFELLLGDTSKNYLDLYNQHVLDDTFGFSVSMDRTFYFADIGGDAEDPHQFSEAIVEVLNHAASSDELTQDRLELIKKEKLGKLLQSFNSLEFIANQMSNEQYSDATIFDLIDIVENITLDDIKNAAKRFIKPEAISVFHVLPKENDM